MHFVVIYANATLACIFNSLLLYLIKTTITKIGSYSTLLSVMAFFNMCYDIIHIAVAPFALFEGHMGILAPTGIFANNPTIGYALILLYCSFYGQSLILLTYHFLYRYIAVCKHHLISLMHRPKTICVCILVHILVAIFWALNLHFFFNDEEARTLLTDFVKRTLGINVAMSGMVAAAYRNPSNVIHVRPWIGAVLAYILMSVPFSIMIFCAISIHRKLRGCKAASKHNFHVLQVQLYRALLVQTIVPLILEFCACFMITFIPMTGLPIDAEFTTLCISAYTVVEPLVVVYYVRDYRIALLKKLRFWKPTTSQITSVAPQHATAGNVSMNTRTAALVS